MYNDYIYEVNLKFKKYLLMLNHFGVQIKSVIKTVFFFFFRFFFQFRFQKSELKLFLFYYTTCIYVLIREILAHSNVRRC